MPRYVLIANPGTKRCETYRRELLAFWAGRGVTPDVEVVPWADVVPRDGNLDGLGGVPYVVADNGYAISVPHELQASVPNVADQAIAPRPLKIRNRFHSIRLTPASSPASARRNATNRATNTTRPP